MSNYAGPETINAIVEIDGAESALTLVRVAADRDADRPWRVEAPGNPIDGWLLAESDLRRRVA